MRENDKVFLQSCVSFLKSGIQGAIPVSGGSINECYHLISKDNRHFFVKINRLSFADNFENEKFNLEYLKNKSSLIVPEVWGIVKNEVDHRVYLVLEYLEKTAETKEFYELFGKGLAELHQHSHSHFGWFQDNYIGSLSQSNSWCEQWIDFFVTQRLEPLVKKCFDSGMWEKRDLVCFENLYKNLGDIFPKEVPSLLHGDLWQGNRMAVSGGVAVFDAACYFGHREMDIAMNFLFGQLPGTFFDAYNAVYPLEKGFLDRKDLYNLYPLLVHAVLFGRSYIYEIKSIIKKFA